MNQENEHTQKFLGNIIATANKLKELQCKRLNIRNTSITEKAAIVGGGVLLGTVLFIPGLNFSSTLLDAAAGVGRGVGYGVYNLINLYKLSNEKKIDYLFNIGILMEAFSVNKYNGLSYLGYHEKIIYEEYNKVKDKNLKEKWNEIFKKSTYVANVSKEDQDELIKILKSIIINYKIREVLKKNFFYGIIGQSNSGKSTLLEKLLPGEIANATARETTTEIKPYKIIDIENTWFTMLDYPHFSSTDINHKLQFLFSRFLLDYVFFVCRAQDRTNTDDIENFLELADFSFNRRFIIFLNQADLLWYEIKNGIETFSTNEELNKTKKLVLEKFVDESEEKVHLTSLNYDYLREDYIDDLKSKTDIKTIKYLRKLVFEKIVEKVPDKYSKSVILLKDDLKRKLEEKRNEYENLSVLSQKKIIIINSLNKIMFKQLHLITGDNKCNSPDRFHADIKNFDELKETINSNFNITNPVIRAEKDPKTDLGTFEEILKCDYHVFIISGNVANP